MKRLITLLLIAVVTTTGLCACTNTLKTANEKPPLEAALDTFFDREADYDSTHFPAKFTQDELDEYIKNNEHEEQINTIISEYADYMDSVDPDFKPTDIEILNRLLTYDYAFRPAFHKNEEDFRESISVLFDENYLYNEEHQYWTGAYISVYRTSELSSNIVDFAVPIIDEYSPTLPQPDIAYLNEYDRWQWHNSLSEMLLVNIGDYDRLNADAEISRTWMKEMYDAEQSG